jgi:hypothetical protein
MNMVFYFASNMCMSGFNYYIIPWLNENLASAEKYSGPLRFRWGQVLLYYRFTYASGFQVVTGHFPSVFR